MPSELHDSQTSWRLSLEEHFYVAIIVIGFCGLATQKLIHYPMALMAIGGIVVLTVRAGRMYRSSEFLLPYLFCLVWLPMCLGTIHAANMSHSLATTLTYLHFLPASYFIIYVCAIPRVCFWVEKWVFYLVVVVILDALLQFFSGFNLLGYPYDVDANADNVEILTGIFYPKERLGLILAGLFPVIFYIAAKARLKMFYFVTLAPAYFFVLLMTFKRSAWVMFLAGIALLFVFFIFRHGKLKISTGIKYSSFLVVVIGIGFVSSPMFPDRLSKNIGFFSGDIERVDIASNHRISLWRTGLEIFKENPLLGIGPRGFRHVYTEYADANDYWLQDGRRGQTHPHSNVVEILIETGVLGLVGYLAFYAYFLHQFFRQKCLSRSLVWSLTVLVVWCPLNTHLAFYGSYWSSFAWMLVAISLASFRVDSRQ